jgi:hypothetical protein
VHYNIAAQYDGFSEKSTVMHEYANVKSILFQYLNALAPNGVLITDNKTEAVVLPTGNRLKKISLDCRGLENLVNDAGLGYSIEAHLTDNDEFIVMTKHLGNE